MSPDSNAASAAGNHRHVLLAFVIGVLLTLMPLKFQSFNIATPFEAHSALMSSFIVSVLVYAVSLAIVANLQGGNNPYHHVIVDKISILSGSLAAVSLVLIIVPAPGWFFLIVWIFFLFKYIYDACRELRRLYQEKPSTFDVFHQVFGLNARHNEPINLVPV